MDSQKPHKHTWPKGRGTVDEIRGCTRCGRREIWASGRWEHLDDDMTIEVVDDGGTSRPPAMFVASMDTQSFSFVALGATAAQAGEAMAAAFDAHLKAYGDGNRERFLTGIDAVDDREMLADSTFDFGSDLGAFAAALDDYYGIAVFQLEPGRGMEQTSADGLAYLTGRVDELGRPTSTSAGSGS